MLDQSAMAVDVEGDDAGSLGRGESGGEAPCPVRDPPTSPLTRGSQARLSRRRTPVIPGPCGMTLHTGVQCIVVIL